MVFIYFICNYSWGTSDKKPEAEEAEEAEDAEGGASDSPPFCFSSSK